MSHRPLTVVNANAVANAGAKAAPTAKTAKKSKTTKTKKSKKAASPLASGVSAGIESKGNTSFAPTPAKKTARSSAHSDSLHHSVESEVNPQLEQEPEHRCNLSISALENAMEEWLLDCEYRLHSPRTLETRRSFLKNLLWFLRHRNCSHCGPRELKTFLHYLRHGHEEGGRWGKAHLNRSVRPTTVKDYWICLHTLFKWTVTEGILPTSPMALIPKPQVREEEKQPLTPEHVAALLQAARRSQQPRRDEAILLLLLDTGIRASELCGLKIADVDLAGRQCMVLGKGDKWRTVHFGLTTGNALRLYLRQRLGDGSGSSPKGKKKGINKNKGTGKKGAKKTAWQGNLANTASLCCSSEANAVPSAGAKATSQSTSQAVFENITQEPLFVASLNHPSWDERKPLTRSGLLQLIERLGKAAAIQGRPCSPHVLRRTFAVQWLRGGGDVFALQAMLGHTNLQMTQRYLSLARADIAAQARQFSPADRLQDRLSPDSKRQKLHRIRGL